MCICAEAQRGEASRSAMSADERMFTNLSSAKNEYGRRSRDSRGAAREIADQMRRWKPGGDAKRGAEDRDWIRREVTLSGGAEDATFCGAKVKQTGATEETLAG